MHSSNGPAARRVGLAIGFSAALLALAGCGEDATGTVKTPEGTPEPISTAPGKIKGKVDGPTYERMPRGAGQIKGK